MQKKTLSGGKTFAYLYPNDELMKKYSLLTLWSLLFVMAFSSCNVIGGIFKAGVWVGIVIVVLVILLIIWLVGRGRS